MATVKLPRYLLTTRMHLKRRQLREAGRQMETLQRITESMQVRRQQLLALIAIREAWDRHG